MLQIILMNNIKGLRRFIQRIIGQRRQRPSCVAQGFYDCQPFRFSEVPRFSSSVGCYHADRLTRSGPTQLCPVIVQHFEDKVLDDSSIIRETSSHSRPWRTVRTSGKPCHMRYTKEKSKALDRKRSAHYMATNNGSRISISLTSLKVTLDA